jgi:hypothetical protein
MNSSEPLLIDLSNLGHAGIWYQWLTVVCALAYEEAHRQNREIAFRTDALLDQEMLRLTGGALAFPPAARADQSGFGHPWKVTTGTRSYDAFNASVPVRRSIYEKLRIGEESRVAQETIEKIGGPFTCVIIRGIPSARGKGAPLLCMDSVYYHRMVGDIDLEGLIHALNASAWPAQARRNPLFVCGDAYEDVYADYFRTHGFEVYTKDRTTLIRNGMDVNGLALVDYAIAVESSHLLGLCTSAMYFAARETRLYLRGNANSWEYVLGQPTDFGCDRNTVTSQEWAAQVLVCDVIERGYPMESFYANFQKGPILVQELRELAAKWALAGDETRRRSPH